MRRNLIVLILAPVILGAMPFPSNGDFALADTDSNYFPLTAKNQWVYAVSKPGVDGREGENSGDRDFGIVSIVSSEMIDGKEVCLTNNYGFGVSADPIAFFTDDQGKTCEYQKQKFALWYPWTDMGCVILPLFGLEDCMRGSSGIMIHIEEVTVPAGTFHDAFLVTYDRVPCCDSGLVSEIFANKVGLVERKVNTIAGIQTWALVRATIAGKEVGSGRSLPVTDTTWGGIKSAFAN